MRLYVRTLYKLKINFHYFSYTSMIFIFVSHQQKLVLKKGGYVKNWIVDDT